MVDHAGIFLIIERGVKLRLDKYLKVSRLIKRRTVAKEACDKGAVKVNGKVSKSSVDVKVGDEIEIVFGDKISKYRITDIKEHVLKNDATELYEFLGQERNLKFFEEDR